MATEVSTAAGGNIQNERDKALGHNRDARVVVTKGGKLSRFMLHCTALEKYDSTSLEKVGLLNLNLFPENSLSVVQLIATSQYNLCTMVSAAAKQIFSSLLGTLLSMHFQISTLNARNKDD